MKTSGATLTAADVSVDMEVRTISGIDKDQLHDKLSVITHVNDARKRQMTDATEKYD